MGDSTMTTERRDLISRLPLRANGGLTPMQFIEASELLADISTDAIREALNLEQSYLSTAAYGLQFSEWDETNLLDYCRLWNIEALSFARVQNLTDHLKSLQFYDDLTPQNDGYCPEERTSQATAILTVVMHQKELGVNGWYLIGCEPNIENYPYIDDAKLRELLLASDYDREMLVDLITGRNIFDGEELARLLESTHTALTGGVL